jgi:hypothetical protein
MTRGDIDGLLALARFGSAFMMDPNDKAQVQAGIAFVTANESEILELEPLAQQGKALYVQAQPIITQATPIVLQAIPLINQVLAVLKKYGQ